MLILMPSSLRRIAFGVLGLCLGLALLLALPPSALGVTRDEALSRGEVWVIKNVPYSQSRYAEVDGTLIPSGTSAPYSKGYRTDCSGFASMCLSLTTAAGAPLSLDTATLPYRCTEITGDTLAARKAKLRPGDLMIKPKTSTYGGHVVVFVRWVDAARTRYVGYHESGSGTGAIASEIPYPYWNNDTRFRPFRYKAMEESALRRSRTWYGPLKPSAPIGTRLFSLDPAVRTGFFIVP